MAENHYQKLAEHLDQLPGGFAPSETGADIRLLKRLFTQEEALLAIHLNLDREPVEIIAAAAGLSISETEDRLNEMSRKGLIFSTQEAGGSALYQAVPWVIGIYEFQVNIMDEDLVQALDDYWGTIKPRSRPQTIPQLRTIPVGESIEPQHEALPYEQVNLLVKTHDRFAVAPCICRRYTRIKGEACDAPEESCLMFGEWADYYVEGGRGRYIDQAEVLDILQRADASNLVLQPTNSQDIAAICCCCGCCCGILNSLKRFRKPARFVSSSFMAQLDSALCSACWDCLERCQMDALSENGDGVVLNSDRCIGCGLCVTSCTTGALTLKRKSDSKIMPIPGTLNAAWVDIMEAQNQ
jgi:NAD-dependent dihydropyrimidine dehydrogenase PreA subunit